MMARSIQGGSGVILVVDVGNSVTNLGLACEGSLSSAWSVTTPDRLTADEVNLRLRTPVLVNRCSVWYKSFALQQARDGAHHTFADGKWVFTRFFVC